MTTRFALRSIPVLPLVAVAAVGLTSPVARAAEPDAGPATAAEPTRAPAAAPIQIRPEGTDGPTDEQRARLRKNTELSRTRNLMITGWAIAGSSYAASAVMGAIALDLGATEWGATMIVPGFGPFIAAGFAGRESATGALLTAGMGAAQVVGITIGAVGSYRYRRAKNMTILAAPTRDGARIGLTVRF